MRHCWFILLGADALLGSGDSASNPSIATTGVHVFSHETNRLLSVNHSTAIGLDDDGEQEYEERGGDIPIVEKVANSIKSAVTNGQLEAWVKKGETTDDVLKLLKLDDVADDILANHLTSWISYMKTFNQENPTQKASLVAVLTGRYGDSGVAKIIEAAKHVSGTATVAKRLQQEQFQHWLATGQSPSKVLELLKLDQVGATLFTNPLFLTWTKYLDDFNSVNPGQKTTLLSALKQVYDEQTLVPMVIAAQKVQSTEKIAVQIQAEQTQLWVEARKSPTDVFALLKLEDKGKLLFDSPIFTAWLRYSDEFNMVDPENKVTSISTLKKFYKEDDVLTKMILAAGKNPSTANLSKRLHSEVYREWYGSLKPPDSIFKSLKLDKTGSKVFEKPLFTVWSEYVTFISVIDPKIKFNLLTPLAKVYGDKKLSRILIAAEKVPSTKQIASELQDAQLTRWLTERKDPTEVFSLLRVEGTTAADANNLLYEKYVTMFNLPVKKSKLVTS